MHSRKDENPPFSKKGCPVADRSHHSPCVPSKSEMIATKFVWYETMALLGALILSVTCYMSIPNCSKSYHYENKLILLLLVVWECVETGGSLTILQIVKKGFQDQHTFRVCEVLLHSLYRTQQVNARWVTQATEWQQWRERFNKLRHWNEWVYSKN